MKKKDVFGFVVLPVGIVALLAGLRLVSTSDVRGWIALAVGAVLIAVAIRGLRAKPASG